MTVGDHKTCQKGVSVTRISCKSDNVISEKTNYNDRGTQESNLYPDIHVPLTSRFTGGSPSSPLTTFPPSAILEDCGPTYGPPYSPPPVSVIMEDCGPTYGPPYSPPPVSVIMEDCVGVRVTSGYRGPEGSVGGRYPNISNFQTNPNADATTPIIHTTPKSGGICTPTMRKTPNTGIEGGIEGPKEETTQSNMTEYWLKRHSVAVTDPSNRGSSKRGGIKRASLGAGSGGTSINGRTSIFKESQRNRITELKEKFESKNPRLRKSPLRIRRGKVKDLVDRFQNQQVGKQSKTQRLIRRFNVEADDCSTSTQKETTHVNVKRLAAFFEGKCKTDTPPEPSQK